MKVSLNWVKQFTEVKLPVDELVTTIGAQLGAVEEVVDLGAKYKDILVAEIAEKQAHHNADKLAIYQAHVGQETTVQVVSGDQSLEVGDKVAWIQPGAIVPSTYDKKSLTMEARPLRGEMSHGMFGSGAELLLNDNHGGVQKLDTDATPGTLFADAYELNDFIIDIENKMFTHRPDCFGILGVAREIAGIQHIGFKSPDWYAQSLGRIKTGKNLLPLEVRNEAPELVSRFMALALTDITIAPSPLIMQSYIARLGLKPINNIVDITNYLMLLTGQPLHAYDYDKIKARSSTTPTLVARMSEEGEKLRLLNGKDIICTEPTVIIATDQEPVGIGGVMGGADTEVDTTTKNIILECGTFDMYAIRRTSMQYGLFTDAVTRFNKGQSPRQNEIVLEEAVATAQYVSGATPASQVFDLIGLDVPAPEPIAVTTTFINDRLGSTLSAPDMTHLLTNVEFAVSAHGDELHLTAPFWRTDIQIPEDIVEEVGRLYGLDQLPLNLPLRPIQPVRRDDLLELKSRLRQTLARAGANEVLTYSFVHSNLLAKANQDANQAFRISNALSPDLQHFRLSLTPSLLDKVHPNIKAGVSEFALFELGKTHHSEHTEDSGLPKEFERLAVVFAADAKAATPYNGAPYYQARKYLMTVLRAVGLDSVAHFEPLDTANTDSATAYYAPGRAATVKVNEQIIGRVGEYRPSVHQAFKLPSFSAGFELGLDALRSAGINYNPYLTLSKFPKVEQDICLEVPQAVTYHQLLTLVDTQLRLHKPEDTAFTLEPIDIYQKQPQKKRITLRLTLVSYLRTLRTQEVNRILEQVADEAKTQLQATRI